MTKIYLIRHAEAEGNLYRRIHGQYDSLVTGRGLRQIEELQKRFEDVKIAAVYSSDLLRTCKTAEAIYLPHKLTLHTDKGLREVAMGVWEDKTWGEVEYLTPQDLYTFNNDPVNWKIEGNEGFFELQKRVTDAIVKIAEENDGRTVAVVSHGSAIRTFLCGAMKVAPEDIPKVPHCDNTSVALLVYDGGEFSVEFHGDNSHLSLENSTFAHQKWWKEQTTFDNTNTRYIPFAPARDTETYISFREDAYRLVHGEKATLPDDYLARALNGETYMAMGLIGDTPAGVCELDLEREKEDGAGWIEFLYMVSSYRRTGIGVQLIGQAVHVFRELGRDKLRLEIEEKNESALFFYTKYGFEVIAERMADGIKILKMEKDILRYKKDGSI